MKRYAPATARNSSPLADVLQRELPGGGTVLEIASGSGEHAVFMARRFPALNWQPTDLDSEALSSIDAWAEEAGLANIRPSLPLDASEADWPIKSADGILFFNSSDVEISASYQKYDACVCINMVHISEWEASIGLFRGCSKYLTEDAPIILYGPYLEDDVETAQSNSKFDCSLKERNPAWGLRTVADVDRVADELGYRRIRRYEMPASNLTLVYRPKSK